MADVEVRALVITMHYSLSHAQLEIPGETLRDLATDTSAEMQLNFLEELKSKKVGETLTNVKITSEG